jgi:hypothetical protein
MTLRLFRCLWGTLPCTGGVDRFARPTDLLDSVQKLGYKGVEVGIKTLIEEEELAREIASRGMRVGFFAVCLFCFCVIFLGYCDCFHRWVYVQYTETAV